MAPLLDINKPCHAMPSVPAVDLTHLDLRLAGRTMYSSTATPLIGDHGWACERLGVPGACQIARRAPVVDYEATELVGLRHHHVCWLLTLIADPTISRYEPLPVPVSDPQAAEILASFVDRLAPPRPTAQAWVVYEAGRRVGACQLRRSGEGHLVGVSLQPDVRERGLGTALFKTLGDWGLRDGEFVAGEVEDDNAISHRAIVSAGYLQGDRYPIVLADSRPAMVTRYQVDD